MVSFLAVGLKETSKIEMFCKVISIFQRNPPWAADEERPARTAGRTPLPPLQKKEEGTAAARSLPRSIFLPTRQPSSLLPVIAHAAEGALGAIQNYRGAIFTDQKKLPRPLFYIHSIQSTLLISLKRSHLITALEIGKGPQTLTMNTALNAVAP
jgi:hypothetical protein